jgi:hypothetical protein
MAAETSPPQANGSKDSTDTSQPRRVNVIFSPETFATLQKLADSQGINMSEAIRQAINVSDLVVGANKDPNARVLIEKGGNVQELKLVR